MIHYIIFYINIVEFFIWFDDSFLSCYFIDKNFIKDILDMWVIIKYTVYSWFKYLIISIHYYYLMVYTILVLPHLTFLSFILKYFYIIKKSVNWYARYFKYWSKRNKWWKTYFRFHRIYNYKIIFFFLCFLLFLSMWKRRQTYLKLGFFLRLFFFYLLALYLSDILVVLFEHSIIGHLLALFIALFIVSLTLN